MNPSVLRCSQEFLFVLSSPLGLAEITSPSFLLPSLRTSPLFHEHFHPLPEGRRGGQLAVSIQGTLAAWGAAGGAGVQPAGVRSVGREAGRSLGLRC